MLYYISFFIQGLYFIVALYLQQDTKPSAPQFRLAIPRIRKYRVLCVSWTDATKSLLWNNSCINILGNDPVVSFEISLLPDT